MSIYDMFDSTVKLTPGNHSTSNRETKFENTEGQDITGVPAKMSSEKQGDKMFMNIDWVGPIKPGWLITDETTLTEYVVEDAEPKPSSINPQFYKLRLRYSHMSG